jgi:hypothetical protein
MTELLRRTSHSVNKKALLLPEPPIALTFRVKLLDKEEVLKGLWGFCGKVIAIFLFGAQP